MVWVHAEENGKREEGKMKGGGGGGGGRNWGGKEGSGDLALVKRSCVCETSVLVAGR